MLFVIQKCLIIKLVNRAEIKSIVCFFLHKGLFEKKLGLEQERDSALIIIALPEGSIQWTDSNDAETQQIPIKLNTENEQSFCCMCCQEQNKRVIKNCLLKGKV